MENRKVIDEIKKIVGLVDLHDEMEKIHQRDVLSWIDSGEGVFRVKKDATPPKHLVSYSVVVDDANEKILLFDHKKSSLMLPSGGHVNKNEMPFIAAKRELKEELGISLNSLITKDRQEDVPFFITVTDVVGDVVEKHTDVSLWYLFRGSSLDEFDSEGEDFLREFSDYKWLSYDEILKVPINKLDIHMHRFIEKIKGCKKDC